MDAIVQENIGTTTASLEVNWYLATVIIHQGKIS